MWLVRNTGFLHTINCLFQRVQSEITNALIVDLSPDFPPEIHEVSEMKGL